MFTVWWRRCSRRFFRAERWSCPRSSARFPSGVPCAIRSATWYSAVPTIHQLLLSRAGGERPAGVENLRFIRSCSAALPPDMMEQMEQLFGAPVLEAYGMTEASHQMCSNPLPPRASKARLGGAGNGHQGQHHGRSRQSSGPGTARRSRDPGPQRRPRIRKQSRGQREIVHQRLVPHRRSRISRCRRLSDR